MENVKDFCFDKVVAGKANSIPDFYDSIIKKQFTNIETIKRTHEALMSYLNMDNKTFFLRLYGSYSKDKYDLLRRGFLTEYPCKTKISFCDNTFSMLFTGLKLANIPFTNLKLSDYLSQSSLITSFGVTSKEKELSYYTSKNALRVDLNSKGWYLAHIKPVGYGYMDLDLKSLFPNPPRHEWNKETKIRISQSNLSDDQNRIIKAHFLRLIHPLNSFLLPKRNIINYDGSNLGEETELISYVSEKIKLIFKDQYDEFDTISMKYDFHTSNTNISNIEWVDYSKKYSNNSQLVNVINTKSVKLSNLKIGQFVQQTFREAFKQGLISNDEIQKLQNPQYSKTNFNANFEILRLKTRTIKDTSGRTRYYSKEIFCENYYLTSQWIESQWNLYLNWLKKIGYNNLISTPLLNPLK
jgi:hypothetical protein